jgi:hypothetical protein
VVGNTFFTIGVAFYGKFEVWIGIEAGEGEWILFVFPVGLIYGEIGCLAGCENEAFGFFDTVMVYIVGNGGYGDDFYGVRYDELLL